MRSYWIKTPRIIRKLFSNYTWCFPSQEKVLYLTFDDGPTPEVTEFVLEQLQQYQAKATFFCIGKNVVAHPNIAQRILTEGHTIGNHTHNHFNGWKTSTKHYLENIAEAEKVITPFTSSLLFRPPYGKIKRSQARALRNKGYQIIMWDVLSADFDTTISNEQCLQHVLQHSTSGSIIVFHDSIKAQERLYHALPKVLAYFSKKGYEFKAID